MNLGKWENIMNQKIIDTEWSDFVKDIASWYPFVLTKRSWIVTRYPDTNRSPKFLKSKEYYENIDDNIKYWKVKNLHHLTSSMKQKYFLLRS